MTVVYHLIGTAGYSLNECFEQKLIVTVNVIEVLWPVSNRNIILGVESGGCDCFVSPHRRLQEFPG